MVPLNNICFQPFSQENVRRCIAHWITMSDIPFSEIENPFFKQMMLCASDNQYKPVLSRSTVRDDIKRSTVMPASFFSRQIAIYVLILI